MLIFNVLIYSQNTNTSEKIKHAHACHLYSLMSVTSCWLEHEEINVNTQRLMDIERQKWLSNEMSTNLMAHLSSACVLHPDPTLL